MSISRRYVHCLVIAPPAGFVAGAVPVARIPLAVVQRYNPYRADRSQFDLRAALAAAGTGRARAQRSGNVRNATA